MEMGWGGEAPPSPSSLDACQQGHLLTRRPLSEQSFVFIQLRWSLLDDCKAFVVRTSACGLCVIPVQSLGWDCSLTLESLS